MNRQPHHEYTALDFSTPKAILSHAKQLEGMTFQDILDLGIVPEGVDREYSKKGYKGGMGTLIEERFFGYKANSNQDADFSEAGVELKATCFDVKRNGEYSAGERLVLTMIPFDRPIENNFYDSHAWTKSKLIMLIYYERDKSIATYNQKIHYATLFTPSPSDLKIIEDDYNTISSLIKSGHAEDLSESLTSYLGACTKGSTAEKSIVNQFYGSHTPAKKRAFCFKRSFMDYVLHHYVMGEADNAESIIKNAAELKEKTFEELVLEKINRHVGKTDKELCDLLGLEYTGNKAQWTRITYALLDVRGEKAEEFEKASISVRTVRVNEDGGVTESLSLHGITFMDLMNETWEEASLRQYFEETRFLFVSFQKSKDTLTLSGARFWAMPKRDIEGSLRDCWQKTKDTVAEGVELNIIPRGQSTCVENNLPKKTENPIAHVRPHTSKSWYKFSDGSTRGDNPHCGDRLPDGREMTRQSFWLNSDYVCKIITKN